MEARKFTINLDRYDVMGDALIIPVPDEVSHYFLDAGHTRMKCTLNGVHQMYRALNSRGEAGRYLLLNKQIAALLDLEEGQAITVELEADESQYGYPVPIEWEEILLFEEPVAKIFAELTPGRKRSVLHLVSSPKREETRIKRALKIADNLLKGVNNPADFLKDHD